MSLKAIVLAAGQGTRMKSTLPKVLHEIAGRPLVLWILDAVADAGADDIAVVVGHGADKVADLLPDGVRPVLQAEQLGTGHAAAVGISALDLDDSDDILVVPGDTPLIRGEALAALAADHREASRAATLLTTDLDDPTGYGRIQRNANGDVVGIIEDKDADPSQLAITEINAGMYAFAAGSLRAALDRVEPHNAQGEYYLTDVVALLVQDGLPLGAVPADPVEVSGVNSLDQLAAADRVMRRRINLGWMRDGVWMLDPERVYIDADVVLSEGVRLYPNVYLEGATSVAAGAEIGPDVRLTDCKVGEEARIQYAVAEDCEVGARANVGPYARLRGGTVIGPEAKAGTFVEMKKTSLGARSKVPHLSYMGDATIGEDTNVGAGAITANWDGFEKHETKIGDNAFVGTDTVLVAPVEVGDEGWTGAGSVITKDVPPGDLAVERSAQREVRDYAARRKRRAAEKRDQE